MKSEGTEVKCLSTEAHEPQDVLLHYLGCLDFREREQYFTILDEDQRLVVDQELRRNQRLRASIREDDQDAFLSGRLTGSIERWRQSPLYNLGMVTVRKQRNTRGLVSGHSQRDVSAGYDQDDIQATKSMHHNLYAHFDAYVTLDLHNPQTGLDTNEQHAVQIFKIDSLAELLEGNESPLETKHVEREGQRGTQPNPGARERRELKETQLRALETRKRVLEDEHPDTLSSISDLAATYWKQGRSVDAADLQEQVLATRKTVLDDEHPDTLRSMSDLAATYWKQGRLVDAAKLQEQVVATRKTILENGHPDILSSISDLAVIYREQGKLVDVERLQLYILETRKRLLGDEHPNTLSSVKHLAATYPKQGQWKKAEELQLRAGKSWQGHMPNMHDIQLPANSIAVSLQLLAWALVSSGGFANMQQWVKVIPHDQRLGLYTTGTDTHML